MDRPSFRTLRQLPRGSLGLIDVLASSLKAEYRSRRNVLVLASMEMDHRNVEF